MRIIAAAALVLVVVFLARGNLLLAISSWVTGGATWTFLDLHRPMMQRPVASFQRSFIWWSMFLWPIRLLFDLYYTAQLISRGERYRVLENGNRCFRSLREATEYAVVAAGQKGDSVMILDELRMAWRYGQFETKSWIIEPSPARESHISEE
jgi:hypothetical protein